MLNLNNRLSYILYIYIYTYTYIYIHIYIYIYIYSWQEQYVKMFSLKQYKQHVVTSKT